MQKRSKQCSLTCFFFTRLLYTHTGVRRVVCFFFFVAPFLCNFSIQLGAGATLGDLRFLKMWWMLAAGRGEGWKKAPVPSDALMGIRSLTLASTEMREQPGGKQATLVALFALQLISAYLYFFFSEKRSSQTWQLIGKRKLKPDKKIFLQCSSHAFPVGNDKGGGMFAVGQSTALLHSPWGQKSLLLWCRNMGPVYAFRSWIFTWCCCKQGPWQCIKVSALANSHWVHKAGKEREKTWTCCPVKGHRGGLWAWCSSWVRRRLGSCDCSAWKREGSRRYSPCV